MSLERDLLMRRYGPAVERLERALEKEKLSPHEWAAITAALIVLENRVVGLALDAVDGKMMKRNICGDDT